MTKPPDPKTTRRLIRRELRTAAAGLHVREAAAGAEPSRIIAGYAILFDIPSAPLWEDSGSEAVEVIDAGAVTRELLDASDIRFTMFHDRQLLLARSRQGSGTLTYEVDERGVRFEFEAPRTTDGDKALELVRRGDISGCSFAFSTYYSDSNYVQYSCIAQADGRRLHTYRVLAITGIYDFTLAADPAYPDTSVEARELADTLRRDTIHSRDNTDARELRHMRSEAARRPI